MTQTNNQLDDGYETGDYVSSDQAYDMQEFFYK